MTRDGGGTRGAIEVILDGDHDKIEPNSVLKALRIIATDIDEIAKANARLKNAVAAVLTGIGISVVTAAILAALRLGG